MEIERKEIDKNEEIAREEYRKETIDRANRLLEEDTDRMKTLRSQTMLVDTLIEREHQVDWKRKLGEMDKQREKYYYNQMLDNIKKQKEREERELKERKEMARKTKEANDEQFEAWENKLTKEITDELEEGKKIAQRAKDDLEDERKERAARRQKCIADRNAMELANKELEGFTKQLDETYRKEDEKIALWEKKKEEQEEKRKKQWEKRQQDKLRTTNLLISHATEVLKSQIDNSERVLAKQIKDQHEKEDEEERIKLQKAQEEWNSIVKSRNYQLEEKERLEREQKIKDKKFAEAWRKQNEEVQREELAERERIYNRNLENAKAIHEQALEREQRRRRVREEEILNEEADLKRYDDEEEKVNKRAQALLEKYEKAGKNVLPLRRAMLPVDELKNAMKFNM